MKMVVMPGQGFVAQRRPLAMPEFLVAASLRLELRNAPNEEDFEKRRLKPALSALAACPKNTKPAVKALLNFNAGVRQAAFGQARNRPRDLEEAVSKLREASEKADAELRPNSLAALADVLHELGVRNEQASLFKEAADIRRELADIHAGDIDAVAKALFGRGLSLHQWAARYEGIEKLREAEQELSDAVAAFSKSGNRLGRGHARYILGLTLLRISSRSKEGGEVRKAAGAFAKAASDLGEDPLLRARAESMQACALFEGARGTNDRTNLQTSIALGEKCAAFWQKEEGTEAAAEYVFCRYYEGLARGLLAAREDDVLALIGAGRLVVQAADGWRAAGREAEAANAESDLKWFFLALEQLARAQKLTADGETCDQEEPSTGAGGSKERRTEQIPRGDDAPPTASDLAKKFAEAQAAVDEVARDLEARLAQAQRFTPSQLADRQALVGEVEQALKLGLMVEVDGREVSELELQRGKTLTWRLKDGYLGFKKHVTKVRRLGAETPRTEIS